MFYEERVNHDPITEMVHCMDKPPELSSMSLCQLETDWGLNLPDDAFE